MAPLTRGDYYFNGDNDNGTELGISDDDGDIMLLIINFEYLSGGERDRRPDSIQN